MNIESNRESRKYGRMELVGRICWTACRPLFRCSPRVCWGWRRFLLRIFGAKVGAEVHIDPSAVIFLPWNFEIGAWSSVGFGALLYNLGPLRIGERVTVSQRAHLCGGSHNFRDGKMTLLRLPISIGDKAWICADAFVGPGVTVGAGAVVGARAVVVKDVSGNSVVAGNPSKVVGSR